MNANLIKVCLNRLLKVNIDEDFKVFLTDQALPQWNDMVPPPKHIYLVRYQNQSMFCILLYSDGNTAYKIMNDLVYGGNKIKLLTASIKCCYEFLQNEI